MATFDIHGLVVTHVQDAATRALLLDSDASAAGLPRHERGLFVSESAVIPSKTTVTDGRLSPEQITRRLGPRQESLAGWDLTGTRLTISGSPPTVSAGPDVADEHPGEPPDWSSLHWVVDAEHLIPGARLRADHLDLGDKIASLAEFRGGVLRGGTPLGEGGNWVWFLRPGFVQAITDRVEYVFAEDSEISIQVRDRTGRSTGTITIAGTASISLINELSHDGQAERAGSKNPTLERKRPVMPDLSAYFEAFEDPLNSIAAVDPLALYRFRSHVFFETGYCIGIIKRD